jgi:hypothetical protein
MIGEEILSNLVDEYGHSGDSFIVDYVHSC